MSDSISSNETPKEIAEDVAKICDDLKASDIEIYDMADTSAIASYYVICTGNSRPHLKAIHDKLHLELKNVQIRPVDGTSGQDWLVIDLGSVIVHIFSPEARSHYDIEKLWKTGAMDIYANRWECTDREVIEDELGSQRPPSYY